MKSVNAIAREIDILSAEQKKPRHIPFAGDPDVTSYLCLGAMIALAWVAETEEIEAPSTVISRDFADFYRRKPKGKRNAGASQ
jgi:hypothetical protein